MRKLRWLVPTIFAATCATAAFPATITAQYVGGTGGVGSTDYEQDADRSIADYVETTEPIVSTGGSVSAAGSHGSASITAALSANAMTGEVKTLLKASRSGKVSTGDQISGPAPHLHSDIAMTEEFILNGTGTFTIYALVDADWSAPQISFSFNLNTGGPSSHTWGHDNFHVDTSGTPDNTDYDSISPTGSITDHLLKVSVDIWDAHDDLHWASMQLNASLATWSWAAFLDASHTAQLYYETTGALIARPVTPGFLSESTFALPQPAPIPLPAGLPLLSAGLLAFGGIRLANRRRT